MIHTDEEKLERMLMEHAICFLESEIKCKALPVSWEQLDQVRVSHEDCLQYYGNYANDSKRAVYAVFGYGLFRYCVKLY